MGVFCPWQEGVCDFTLFIVNISYVFKTFRFLSSSFVRLLWYLNCEARSPRFWIIWGGLISFWEHYHKFENSCRDRYVRRKRKGPVDIFLVEYAVGGKLLPYIFIFCRLQRYEGEFVTYVDDAEVFYRHDEGSILPNNQELWYLLEWVVSEKSELVSLSSQC